MNALTAVGFGAMNLDTIYRVPRVVVDDETCIEGWQSLSGGSAANTIYGLAKLGVSAGFMGAVGDDEAGRSLTLDLRSVGVDTSRISVKASAETGAALCFTDLHGHRALYVNPGANCLLTEADIDSEYVRRAGFLHLSSFVNDEQFNLQKWLVGSLPDSVKLTFAPGAMYARKGLTALAPLLAKTQVLFANQEEVAELTGKGFQAGSRQLLDRGCNVVVVTLGEGVKVPRTANKSPDSEPAASAQTDSPNEVSAHSNGTRGDSMRIAGYIADATNEYVVEGRDAPAQDTTGAGDAFAAGFLYGLVNDKSLQDCGILGEIMARFCISEIGARTGLPSFAELRQEYQKATDSAL